MLNPSWGLNMNHANEWVNNLVIWVAAKPNSSLELNMDWYSEVHEGGSCSLLSVVHFNGSYNSHMKLSALKLVFWQPILLIPLTTFYNCSNLTRNTDCFQNVGEATECERNAKRLHLCFNKKQEIRSNMMQRIYSKCLRASLVPALKDFPQVWH